MTPCKVCDEINDVCYDCRRYPKCRICEKKPTFKIINLTGYVDLCFEHMSDWIDVNMKK